MPAATPAKTLGFGYALAVVQAVLYAMMGIIGKYLYFTGLNPQQAIVLRFTMTFLILGAFLLIRRKQPLFSRNPLVYVQGVFFMGSALFYFLAVDETTAGLATALLYAYPAVVALLSTVVFKERFTLKIATAVILALAGIFAISGVVPGTIALSPVGVLYGVASCLAFAVCTVIGQKVVEKDEPLTITFSMTTVGVVMLLALFPATFPDMLHLTPLQLGLGASMAVFTTILPVVALLVSIRIIGATKASLISTSETPFSLLFAYLILGEVLTISQGIGCALIVASILAATMPSKRRILEMAKRDANGKDGAGGADAGA